MERNFKLLQIHLITLLKFESKLEAAFNKYDSKMIIWHIQKMKILNILNP